jgi:hypothetical protein
MDFQRGSDKIDISAIDGNLHRTVSRSPCQLLTAPDGGLSYLRVS